MFKALYFFVRKGQHYECFASRECRYCQKVITFKELRLGEVVLEGAPKKYDSDGFVPYHRQCWLAD